MLPMRVVLRCAVSVSARLRSFRYKHAEAPELAPRPPIVRLPNTVPPDMHNLGMSCHRLCVGALARALLARGGRLYWEPKLQRPLPMTLRPLPPLPFETLALYEGSQAPRRIRGTGLRGASGRGSSLGVVIGALAGMSGARAIQRRCCQ